MKEKEMTDGIITVISVLPKKISKRFLIELIVVLLLAVGILYAYNHDIRSTQTALDECNTLLAENYKLQTDEIRKQYNSRLEFNFSELTILGS